MLMLPCGNPVPNLGVHHSPKCRARIWRSEIEAAISETDDFAARLQDRRNNRKPCECPPKDRPQD